MLLKAFAAWLRRVADDLERLGGGGPGPRKP